MQLIPLKTFTYKSNLTIEQAVNSLEYNVETPKFFSFFSARKAFEGTINGNKFSLKRIISYRNSFRPTVEGKIISKNNKTIIKVTIRPTIVSLVIMMFILPAAFVMLQILICFHITKTFPSGDIDFYFFVTCFIIYIPIIIPFNYERYRINKSLKRIFRVK